MGVQWRRTKRKRICKKIRGRRRIVRKSLLGAFKYYTIYKIWMWRRMVVMNNSQRIIINLYKNHYYNGIRNPCTQLSFALLNIAYAKRSTDLCSQKHFRLPCLYCYQTIQMGKQHFERVYIRFNSFKFRIFVPILLANLLNTLYFCWVWMQNLAFFASTNNMLKICYKSCAFSKMFTSSYHCEI